MKKIIILLLTLSFINLYSNGNKIPKSCKKRLQIEKSIVLKAYKIFTIINENIDSILTTKGAIKTLMFFSPFLGFYCYYFGSDPIQILINKIVRVVGKAEETYKVQKEIGKSFYFWQTIKDDPLSIISMMSKKIIEKTIYMGLPFLAGIFAKAYFGSSS